MVLCTGKLWLIYFIDNKSTSIIVLFQCGDKNVGKIKK